jgi:peptide/nickel transport system permease protein
MPSVAPTHANRVPRAVLLLALRRIPQLLATLLIVSFLTYMLTSLLPGDPALLILGAENITEEQIDAVHEELGLDDPLPVRYVSWLGDVLTGDLGRSFRTNQDVLDAIVERLPVTLEVGLLAIFIGLAVALPLGAYSAYRANGIVDKSTTAITFGLLSIPSFMLALLFIYVFAVNLGWFPATGWRRLTEGLVENLKGAIMPAMSLAVAEVAAYTRLLRTDMIATLQQDFVLMAKSKGMSERFILFRHAMRPSSLSLITVLGLNLGGLIGGAVLVETIFALPGVGRLLVDSVNQRDLVMVQGIVLFVATSYVVVNFLVDIVYAAVDPRIRGQRVDA